MKYKVLVGRINDYPLSSILTASVEREINDGWRPQGGVAVHGGFIYQAMVKEEDETKE